MPSPHAVFLFAGGPGSAAGSYAEVLRRIYSQTGSRKPRIAYVGAATDDNPRFFSMMSTLLQGAGACEIELVPLAKGGNVRTARAVIESSDLVFFGGGDVELGMKRLHERDIISALSAAHAAGTPFAGISAGAIMLGRQWVRWSDPDDDASAELFDCLGLAGVICDTHGEDDDWQELRRALALAGGSPGYGIRTGAAMRAVGQTVEVLAGQIDILRPNQPHRRGRSA